MLSYLLILLCYVFLVQISALPAIFVNVTTNFICYILRHFTFSPFTPVGPNAPGLPETP